MGALGPLPRRAAYPGKVAIRHVVEAAKAAGLDVAGIEVSADGSIRIMEARAVPSPATSEFDKWNAAGLL